MREVDDIGRIVIEFNEQDSDAVEKIVCAVNRHPAFEELWLSNDSLGNENNSVGCHVRSLRRKLYKEYPNTPFIIRCFRSIGYCLETKL